MGKHKGVNCIYLCPPNREVKKHHCREKSGTTGMCYRLRGAESCNYQQEEKSVTKPITAKEEWILIEGNDGVARRYGSRSAMMNDVADDFDLSTLEDIQVLHVNVINEYDAVVAETLELTLTGE